jgi:hypothetical protein
VALKLLAPALTAAVTPPGPVGVALRLWFSRDSMESVFDSPMIDMGPPVGDEGMQASRLCIYRYARKKRAARRASGFGIAMTCRRQEWPFRRQIAAMPIAAKWVV